MESVAVLEIRITETEDSAAGVVDVLQEAVAVVT